MRDTDTHSAWSLKDADDEPFPRDDPFGAAPVGGVGGDGGMSPKALRHQGRGADPSFIGLITDDDIPAQSQDPFQHGARNTPLHHAPHQDVSRPAPAKALADDAAGTIAAADQPVPRIRIHAACDRQEVARLIQSSSSDRRLAKAQVSIELGGIEAAIARYAGETSPDLLIIDSLAPPKALLACLDRLSEVIESGCKLMIIGAANDIELYRHLIRIGVSEYLVTPLQPVNLIRAIGALYTDPSKPFAGRTAAFIGARGGVGASSIAHNVAWYVAERQAAHATLVDLDLPFGTATLDFNEEPGQTIQDALAAADRVDEVFLERVMTRPTPRLQLFTSPARLDRIMEIDPDAVGMVLDKVRRTGPHIFLDLPHAWSAWMLATLSSVDDLVIVANPDLASLRNTKNIVDFSAKSRPNDALPMVVMNMVGVPKRPEIPMKDFAKHIGVPIITEIPFDPAAFGAAANNGQMLGQAAEQSKAFQQIAALAASLTGREAQVQKPKSLFSQLGILKR